MDLHIIKLFLTAHALAMQILLYALVIIFLWRSEKKTEGTKHNKWRHTWLNTSLMLSALPIQIVFGIMLMTLSHWVVRQQWGLVYLLPHFSSPWIKYGFMFLLLDLLDYCYHTATHRIPFLWRFHLVHHCDSQVDVSTTIREHPVETIIRNSFLLLCVYISGASFGVLFLRQMMQTLANISSHTTIPLSHRSARILGLIFITPNLHQTHHHFKLPYTNCNYGDVFSIWDRIFGTFSELSMKDIIYGLDTHTDETATGTYLGIIGIPFSRRRLVSMNTAE